MIITFEKCLNFEHYEIKVELENVKTTRDQRLVHRRFFPWKSGTEFKYIFALPPDYVHSINMYIGAIYTVIKYGINWCRFVTRFSTPPRIYKSYRISPRFFSCHF